jgi:hypothetical protein
MRRIAGETGEEAQTEDEHSAGKRGNEVREIDVAAFKCIQLG